MTPDPVPLLQELIRFDTTNPPGNEKACVDHIDALLRGAGLETERVGRSAERPNLLARLPGRGAAPPLLLYGHVDVVTTAHQPWTHPPFAAVEEGGYIWGRGALDMKGGVAMLLSALLRAKASGVRPAGDILLAILVDEEAGGAEGAQYLVEQHAGRFDGIRWALGEFGGFTLHMGGKRFYPIQVGEKQRCWMRAVVRGPGGHASMPRRGGAMTTLARILAALDGERLPVHLTSVPEAMIRGMVAALEPPFADSLAALLDPATTDTALDHLGPQGAMFDAALHNTVAVTIVRGGEKINVLPSEIVVEMDGRILPGFGPEDMLREIRALVGENVFAATEDGTGGAKLEVVEQDDGPATPDLGFFDTLSDILRQGDPEAIPLPLMMPGATDGRFFSRLGIQTYGFLPMNLPEGFNFVQTIHAADERIPVDAVRFGAEAVYRALERYSV